MCQVSYFKMALTQALPTSASPELGSQVCATSGKAVCFSTFAYYSRLQEKGCELTVNSITWFGNLLTILLEDRSSSPMRLLNILKSQFIHSHPGKVTKLINHLQIFI